MAQTTPPTITAAPTAPQRGVKATFSTLVDAFVTWLVAAVTQFGAVATNVYNNAVDAYNNAVAAAGSASSASTYANNASASATAAAAASSASLWVSGTTYTAGQVVFSPVDYRSYRRKTGGAGTTDPSADSTNWVLISNGAVPLLHVREEQASGTSAGTATGPTTITRVLNTVKTNGIAGASLSSNQVTLPAGTYEAWVRVPAFASDVHRAWLASASGVVLLGAAANGSGAETQSFTVGQFTLASTTAVWISHYLKYSGSNGLGTATSQSTEIYAEAIFRKVA